MDAAVEALDFHRHHSELLETWQAKVLRAAKGQLGAVVLSVLAHNFDDAMPVLLRVVFPGFTSIAPPFFCSAARVAKNGVVMADLVTKDGRVLKNVAIFADEKQMTRHFRKLADRIKLSDADRVQLFNAVKRWVVCDFRLDPNMDANDPDAKRLVVH